MEHAEAIVTQEQSHIPDQPPGETQTKGRGRVGGLSGLLASQWVILGCVVGALAINLAGYTLMSAMLLFFALLGLAAAILVLVLVTVLENTLPSTSQLFVVLKKGAVYALVAV